MHATSMHTNRVRYSTCQVCALSRGACTACIERRTDQLTVVLSCRDLFSAGNGSLTGTIVITSGCAALQPWASAIGGIVGGLIYLPSSLFMLHVLKIDDPVDAFTVRPSTITRNTSVHFASDTRHERSLNPQRCKAMGHVQCTPLVYCWRATELIDFWATVWLSVHLS